MTKVVGIAIVRTGADLNEPIPVVMASDLASFGFFQRQVRDSMVFTVGSLVIARRLYAPCGM
jgi:hypothetical protein